MHAVNSHPVRVHTTRMRGIQHQRSPTSLTRTSEKKSCCGISAVASQAINAAAQGLATRRDGEEN